MYSSAIQRKNTSVKIAKSGRGRGKMKIGVFDSGLGGLLILKSLVKELPDYDFVYLGDTARVPYGNRSQETLYKFLEESVDFLFRKDCALVLVACNTASAEALRKIQMNYLPRNYPNRRVLGVIIPTAEEAVNSKSIGILATEATVQSGSYLREIKKLNPRAKVFQSSAPLLVPMIEQDGIKWIEPILESYLNPLIAKKIDTLILGCTHYPIIKQEIKKICAKKIGKSIGIISQDEIVPKKLKSYLLRHAEINNILKKNKERRILVTDITPAMKKLSKQWFGRGVRLELIALNS